MKCPECGRRIHKKVLPAKPTKGFAPVERYHCTACRAYYEKHVKWVRRRWV